MASAGGSGGKTIPAPLPAVVVQQDLIAIVQKCDAMLIMPAIAQIENLDEDEVDLNNVSMVGTALPKPVLFKDLEVASAKAAWIKQTLCQANYRSR